MTILFTAFMKLGIELLNIEMKRTTAIREIPMETLDFPSIHLHTQIVIHFRRLDGAYHDLLLP